MSVAHVDLLLRVSAIGDHLNVMTWRIDDREPNLDELRLLFTISDQDAADYAALLRLEADVQASFDQDLGDG